MTIQIFETDILTSNIDKNKRINIRRICWFCERECNNFVAICTDCKNVKDKVRKSKILDTKKGREN